MIEFYDKDGKTIERDEWAIAFSDINYKRIAHTEVGNTEVSTVWMGIDHSFEKGSPPLIFETMTFGGEEEICERYTTQAEAVRGHFRVVDRLKNARQDG